MKKKLKKRDTIFDKIQHKFLFRRYLTLCVGCFLAAFAFNVFFLPHHIVYGGVSGVSIILNSIFQIDPSLTILVSSFLLLGISFFFLGKEKTMGSVVGSFLFPLFVKLTENIGTLIQFNLDNMLLIVLFGGLVAGLGAGIIFKTGFTTGGTDIINQIVSKYAKISIGKAMLCTDGLIVLSAGFFLGGPGVIFAWEKVMYAIIVLYLLSVMTDKVILGISESKAFYIVTTHETAVKKFVLEHLSHGVTVLEASGGFTGNRQKVILCIIPTKEYFTAKEGIEQIDPHAFFLVTDAYEVSGGA